MEVIDSHMPDQDSSDNSMCGSTSASAGNLLPRSSTTGSGAPVMRWIGVAVVVGVILRLLQYLGNRSLWLDEALLAPSILDRSFGEILDPTATDPTPFGFVAIQKLLVSALGDSELVLRLFPVVAGVLSVVLFASIARRLLPELGAVVAVGLFAASPFLIYYASELKHYSTDVAAATVVLLLGARMLTSRLKRPELLGWAAAALLAVAISRTSVFVIAGTGATLIAVQLRNGAWRPALGLALASVPAALLAILPFLRPRVAPVAGEAQEPGYLVSFWSSGFMPLPPRTSEEWMWFPHTAWRVFQDPLGLIQNTNDALGTTLALIGAAAFVTGASWLAIKRPSVLAIAAIPILLTLLASGLRLYPFGGDWNTGGRVILFLVPGFFLVMGAGAGLIASALAQRHRTLGFAAIALLIAPPLVHAATTVPYGRGELKPLLEFVETNWQDGDRLYVHYDATPAFRYYAPRYGFTAERFVEGVCARSQPERYLGALSEYRGSGRLWVLFTAGLGAELFDERALMVDFLDHVGTRLDDRIARGTSVYLFEMSEASSDEPFAVRLPRLSERIEEDCRLWE